MTDLSVIIPIYNAEKTIKKCLDSVISQQNFSWQAICVDDGSADNSAKIVKKYAKTDKRIILIENQKNLGAGLSRNTAMEKAEGKYIINLDADDYFCTNCLKKLIDFADLYNLDMCFYKANFIFMNEETKKNIPQNIVKEYKKIYNGRELLNLFLDNNEFFYYCCSVLYKNKFLKEHNFQYKKIIIGEGGDFILRAMLCANKVTVYPNVIYNYCIHNNSVTNSETSYNNLLIGNLTQLSTIINNTNSELFNKLFIKQQRFIIGNIASLDLTTLKQVYNEISDNFIKLLFNCFTAYRDTYNINFTQNDIKKIKQFKNIYIYGAGYATTECILKLSDIGIFIKGIVVTNISENKIICGHKVDSIKNINMDNNDSLFIICANSKYTNDIISSLNEYGFFNYINLNIII